MVHVANTPNVSMRGPAFVKAATYQVTWPNGDQEKVTIIASRPDTQRMPEKSAELGQDGWVEVQSGGARRWINILAARSIEEAR
jgi:hypothetical protein